MHLGMVGSWRFLLQTLRGGQPEWFATVTDAFFRSVDQVLPVYWALIGLQHALDYHQQARARAERAALLEARLMESQLQALQQQLHPHFLFNTLHAISTLVHRDPDKADLMIERLSDLLRVTLHKVGVQEVELAQELDYLRAYLDIEQVHFGDRLRVEYCIDAAVLDALVPTLILQPLVENAVRHGLEPVVRGGTLSIEARADGDVLVVQVKDDGAGYPSSRPQRSGVGLTNTRSRLDRLYGEEGVLRISDKPGGGTVVDIRLPLRRDEVAFHALGQRASEAVA